MMHGFMGRCLRWSHSKSLGILILRIALGSFFIAHGVSKFQNMEMMNEFFASLGFGPPWASIVATCEVLSGTAILLGAFLWPAALLVTSVMVVAALKVTGPNPSDQPFLLHFISGWGTNAVYAAAAICLAFCGAGRWSLTNLYFRRRAASCRDCMAAHGHGHDCPSCPPEHHQ